jgi:hypothetical protein
MEIEKLKKQVEELQKQLETVKSNANKREKIEKMSAEVVDSNPYSRLMALQRMGIVKEYERIREKSVAVVGKNIITKIELNRLYNNFFNFRCWWSGICYS